MFSKNSKRLVYLMLRISFFREAPIPICYNELIGAISG